MFFVFGYIGNSRAAESRSAMNRRDISFDCNPRGEMKKEIDVDVVVGCIACFYDVRMEKRFKMYLIRLIRVEVVVIVNRCGIRFFLSFGKDINLLKYLL